MVWKWRLRVLFFLVAAILGRYRGRLALLVLAVIVSACASGNNLLSGVVGGVVSERFGSATDATLAAKLNPDYRYLRVEVEGRPPILMVLGYVDPHPNGEIEVWYSAKREVIKTQAGRIVATFGLETDWRAVRFHPAPLHWSDEPSDGRKFERTRDEMPGYRYAITDQMEVRRVPGGPPKGVSAALNRSSLDGLEWFQEATLRSTGRGMPPAWFAWGKLGGSLTVIYSEQCLAPEFCLRLMRWPLQGRAG
jgi:hypothetical protein